MSAGRNLAVSKLRSLNKCSVDATRRSKYQNKVAGNEKLIVVAAIVESWRFRAVVSILPVPTDFRTDRQILDGANIKAKSQIGKHTWCRCVERSKPGSDVGIVVASDLSTGTDGANIVNFIKQRTSQAVCFGVFECEIGAAVLQELVVNKQPIHSLVKLMLDID